MWQRSSITCTSRASVRYRQQCTWLTLIRILTTASVAKTYTRARHWQRYSYTPLYMDLGHAMCVDSGHTWTLDIHGLWTYMDSGHTMYMDSGHVFLGYMYIQSDIGATAHSQDSHQLFWLPGNEAKGLRFECQQQCHIALSHSIWGWECEVFCVCVCMWGKVIIAKPNFKHFCN